jgi:predicted lactoylglutathione lyase
LSSSGFFRQKNNRFGKSKSFKSESPIAALDTGNNGKSKLTHYRMPMEQRISLITLGVTDLNRSREFYERLGWRRSMAKAEGIAFFQTGGMALALYPREELAKDANVAATGHGFNGIALAYNARNRNEVDSVLKEAESAGAKILKPAQEAFWGGYSGYFSDPDGFLWEVAWNPQFAIAKDGSIQLPD